METETARLCKRKQLNARRQVLEINSAAPEAKGQVMSLSLHWGRVGKRIVTS